MTGKSVHLCDQCVIIGAGPAGLTAAYELSENGAGVIVLEQDRIVGGIARTVEHKGYRFDIGGHRFFSKVSLINEWWTKILGDDFQLRSRLSRIHYNGKFFDYPLRPINALRGLGMVEAILIMASYVRARTFPTAEEKSFEQWICNRFGRRLFEIFFKTYTEKVWGLKCSEIGADWASERIKNLNLAAALKDMVGGRNQDMTTLIRQFYYPRLGPGMMWEKVAEILNERGVAVHLNREVVEVNLADGLVSSVTTVDENGKKTIVHGGHFVSSMPIRELISAMKPAPPEPVLTAARQLRYRDFLTVGLIVDKLELFNDNWIYVHSPGVKVGRIQNFKNWSPAMVPDAAHTSLGLEYFVQEGDELWDADDPSLVELATRECVALGFIDENDVLDSVVIRMPKAYPVYDRTFKENLSIIRGYLESISNLQLVGRNGQHRYNNQDHSMLTAIYAARNIFGGDFDVWEVNIEEDYHEATGESAATIDRLVPQLKPIT
jgi:protoporphyrinogen oxidase